MKKSQIYSIFLLLWIFLLSSVSFAYAATPNYVGIEKNQTYTWNTTYDDGPLKDLREDWGEEQGWSDDLIDDYVDEIDTDEDLTQLKIVVLYIDDEEKERRYDEAGVRIIYNVYFKEEGEDWDLESEYETFAVSEYNDDVYDFGYFVLDWKVDFDKDKLEWERYKYLHPENPWFISTKIDWDDVEFEIVDLLEDFLDYDEVDVKIDKDENRLEVSYDEDEDDDYEERTYISDYDDNGVLEYYEWQYDGDPIVIVQSQENQIREFVDENMLWIIIGSIAIVAVIIIVIVLIKRK